MSIQFRKYFIGFAIMVYCITTIGIPVYFHYCGGELEEITYVVKSNSCCGDEEMHSEEAQNDDDCCKDESYLIKTDSHFVLKEFSSYKVFNFCNALPNAFAPTATLSIQPKKLVSFNNNLSPPPKLQSERIISSTVFRI